MLFSERLPIDLKDIDFNLAAWIKQLTEERYKAVDKGHRTFKWEGDEIINSEIIGFNKIIHRYRAEMCTADKVIMKSKQSRIFIFHLFPVKGEVIWSMQIINKKSFLCSVEVKLPNKILDFASYLQFNPFFLKRHVKNETRGYLRDLLNNG